jgi:hypothetical protein
MKLEEEWRNLKKKGKQRWKVGSLVRLPFAQNLK